MYDEPASLTSHLVSCTVTVCTNYDFRQWTKTRLCYRSRGERRKKTVEMIEQIIFGNSNLSNNKTESVDIVLKVVMVLLMDVQKMTR